MKKTVIALIAAMMILSMAACRNDKNTKSNSVPEGTSTASASEQLSDAQSSITPESKDNSSSPSGSTAELPDAEEATFNSDKDYSGTVTGKFVDVSKLSDKTKTCVVDVLNGDTLTLDAEGKLAIAKGISIDFSANIRKDKENTSFHMIIAGQESAVIRNESGTYVIDNSSKTATLSKAESSDENESAFYTNPASGKVVSFIASLFGKEPLTYSKSGSEVFEGEALTYEEYTVGSIIIRLYYDGNTIKYASIDKSGAVSTVKVNTLTAKAEPDSFKIPEGYTIK